MNLALLTGFIMTASLFNMMAADEPTTVGNEPQKKEQKVKVLVKQDGKEIKIDTTFNFADEKAVRAKVDSVLKAEGIEHMSGDGKHVMIMKSRKHPAGPGEQEYSIFIQEGDSGTTKDKKVLRIVAGRHGETVDWEGDMIPPPPPVPPIHLKAFKFHGGDPFAFDPNDDDIISYDKKDLGKGLEKITIVRKKRDAKDPAHVVEGVKIEKEEIAK